jgi:hypothetical protein
MIRLYITEDYEISKNVYEYCLTHFQYPDYDRVPDNTVYHNTKLYNVDNIMKNGLLISKSRDLEYTGNMIWTTILPNQKGYGGITIAFTLNGLDDKKCEKVNNTEYCIYQDIPVSNILFIDLPVYSSNSGGLKRLSDMPRLINRHGVEKVEQVYNKANYKYIPLEAILPYIK